MQPSPPMTEARTSLWDSKSKTLRAGVRLQNNECLTKCPAAAFLQGEPPNPGWLFWLASNWLAWLLVGFLAGFLAGLAWLLAGLVWPARVSFEGACLPETEAAVGHFAKPHI